MSTPISGVDALVMISDTLNVVEHLLLELSPTSTLEYSLVVMRLSSWCVLDSFRGRSFKFQSIGLMSPYHCLKDHWNSISVAFWAWKRWSPQLRFSASIWINNILYCRISDSDEACFSSDWPNCWARSRFCACSSQTK